MEYDPSIVSYEELLEIFWKSHDPTQVRRVPVTMPLRDGAWGKHTCRISGRTVTRMPQDLT